MVDRIRAVPADPPKSLVTLVGVLIHVGYPPVENPLVYFAPGFDLPVNPAWTFIVCLFHGWLTKNTPCACAQPWGGGRTPELLMLCVRLWLPYNCFSCGGTRQHCVTVCFGILRGLLAIPLLN